MRTCDNINNKDLNEYTVLVYANMLILIDNDNEKIKGHNVLTYLRQIVGNPNIDSDEYYDLIDKNFNLFYRIPFETSYINKDLDVITLNSDITYVTLPKQLNIFAYDPVITKYEIRDFYPGVLGNKPISTFYLYAKNKIYLPVIFYNKNNDHTAESNEFLDLIRVWYGRIKFIPYMGKDIPILVGKDVLFRKYKNKNGQNINVGISPEYPKILIRKVETNELYNTADINLYLNYKIIYKYVQYSETIENGFLSGYICYTNDYNPENIIHIPITGFGRNLDGINPSYLIASAMIGGRTTDRYKLDITGIAGVKQDVRFINWSTRGKLYGDDKYIIKY